MQNCSHYRLDSYCDKLKGTLTCSSHSSVLLCETLTYMQAVRRHFDVLCVYVDISDMRRSGPSQFLQSATMEVEKALQEQNKTHQSRELSATLPQLINPPKPQPPKVPSQHQQGLAQTASQQKLPSPKKSSIIAIEDQGVVSEQVELSPAEVNSFIDQFERFLESEGLESEMEGSEKLLAASQAAQQVGLQATQREKAELIKQMTKAGLTAPKPGLQSAKPVVEVDQGASPSGLKAGSGASVSVGQMGSVSGSSVGLSPNQNLTWQDSYAQSLQQQQQATTGQVSGYFVLQSLFVCFFFNVYLLIHFLNSVLFSPSIHQLFGGI